MVMVTEGASIHRVNTMGQSFLHLLCEQAPVSSLGDDIRVFQRLLKELQNLNFDFSTMDYQGQTFLHTLFKQPNARSYGPATLALIFSIADLDISAPDNSGFSISKNLSPGNGWMYLNYPPLQEVIKKYSKNFSPILHRPLIVEETLPSSIISWIESRISAGDVTHIDEAGDTMLSYLLKNGPVTDGGRFLANCTRKLTTAGARIHMRDRNGETALAIAARRGLRPAVTLLLRRGAHVHSRDNKGVGILVQAEKAMIEATSSSNEILYSRILSCIIALIEAGTKCEPTEEDEWMSRSAAASQRAKTSASSETSPRV